MKAETKNIVLGVLMTRIQQLEQEHDRIGDELEQLEEVRRELAGERSESSESSTAPSGRKPGGRSVRPRVVNSAPAAGKPAPEPSRYKGVFWNKTLGKWCGQAAGEDGKKKTKSFPSQEEAAEWLVEMQDLDSIEQLLKE